MKNSGVEWIGEIPDGWEVVKFKNLHSGTNVGESIDKDFCSDNEEGFIFYTAGLEPIHTSFTDFPLWKYTKENDLLLARNGTPYVYFPLQNAVYSDHIIRVSINNNYSKTFVKYAIEQSISNTVVDTVSIATWSASLWNTQKLPLPPKETQQKIATYLDKKCSKIEETIQNQQQVIEKLKAYKQSLITEAVTGKIKIQNGKVCEKYESYKESGVEWIGKIPSGWTKQKLKFASQIMRGLFSHRPRNDPDYYDGVHPFIQTGEVARAVKYITTYSQTLNELGFSVSREFPAGTVLLTIAANVGDVAILDFNACFPDSVIGFYPKDNVSKVFLYYLLKSMKEQFMKNAIISTQMNLNINIVKEEVIPLPSLKEQEEIVCFLENKSDIIDTAIEQKQNLIEKLTEYKKSLIYECVTGKKEI
ncbi:MAG: restriction endonuclease subunit S [Treponema sp.]|nr:restriction endonuclease subunit S [Treponema sp.]